MPTPILIRQSAAGFLFCGVLIAALCAAVYGAGIGMLTVRGRHRWRVIGAAGFGLLLSLGFRLAVGTPKINPELTTPLVVLVLVTICTAVGVFAPENL